MEPEPDDDAFRRFLERATEDPPDRLVAINASLAGEERRTPARRGPLVAAAVVLAALGVGLAALRHQTTGVTIEPAATPATTTADPDDPAVSGPALTAPPAPVTSAPTTSVPGVPTLVEGVGRAPEGQTAPTTAGPVVTGVPASTLLRLDLDSVAADAPDGTPVPPAVGPDLHVERTGSGTMEAAPGGGRRFLPGGQQRTDHVVLTRVGADVGALVAPSGRATVVLAPLVDVAQRTSVTGRNIHTWFEIVSQDGPDDLVTGLLLQVDPEIGPYFGGAIDGVGFSYVLTPADVAELGAGRVVTLSLEWSPGSGRLVLNGRTLTEIALDGPPASWTPTARLSVGGSASWGAGYFTTRDDGLRSFELVALP